MRTFRALLPMFLLAIPLLVYVQAADTDATAKGEEKPNASKMILGSIIFLLALMAALIVNTIIWYFIRHNAQSFGTASSHKRLSILQPATVDTSSFKKVQLSQSGYVISQYGSWLFRGWVGFFLFLDFIMILACILVYFPDAIVVLGFVDYDGLVTPWLLVFVLVHVGAAGLTMFKSGASCFFMLPVSSLAEATWVLIEEDVDCMMNENMTEIAKEDDMPGPAWWLYESIWGSIRRFRQDTNKTLIPVSSYGGVKQIEYTCVVHVFDEKSEKFTPVGMSSPTCQEVQQVFKEGGLSVQRAHELLDRCGKNEVPVKVPTIFESLLLEFLDINYVFQDIGVWVYTMYTTWNIGSVWLLMMLGSGLYRCFGIARPAQLSIARLARLEVRVHALREGNWVSIDSSGIALGDVIRIEDGSVPVPCDGIIVAGELVVNESMLTGEPMPIQKVSVGDASDAGITKRNRVHAGTSVLESTGPSEGKAVVVVTAVGALTTRGQLVRSVLFPASVKFKFNDQLPFVYSMLLLSALVWLFGYLIFCDMGTFVATCLQMLAVIVWAVNPMLPVSMTMAQAAASNRLKRQGIFCLQPSRIPIAGKISTMVFDKTGTLTKDGMSFSGALDVKNALFEDAVWLDAADDAKVANQDMLAKNLSCGMQRVLGCCHSVTTLKDGTMVGNHVEISMMQAIGWKLSQVDDQRVISSPDSKESYDILRVLEFDHDRMTSGVVLKSRATSKVEVIVKGSYEQIQRISLPASLPFDYERRCQSMATFYTLGVASKVLPETLSLQQLATTTRDELEEGVACCGLLLFSNEMKTTTPAAIKQLKKGAIRCIMCTGDNVLTGIDIGRKSGILTTQRCLVGDVNETTGELFWKDPDSDQASASHETHSGQFAVTQAAWRYLHEKDYLFELWPRIVVYARMQPDDKTALIRYLQDQGLIVGMCGDGGNDCGALRAGHAGLALSEAEASMVAPFSSARDGKSLATVVDLIREGRACLATNFATFHFYMVVNLTINANMLACTIWGNWYLGEWTFLSLDVFIGVVMVQAMTVSGPAETLADHRPSGSMLCYRSIFTIGSSFLLWLVAQIVIWLLLHGPQHSSWYRHVNTLDIHTPSEAWQRKADNHDSAAMTLLLLLSYVTTAFTFSYGGDFRENILQNWRLNLWHGLFVGIIFHLNFTEPSTFSCIFRINCDTDTSLANKNIPFVSQWSTGDIGGCFLGPQIALWQAEIDQQCAKGNCPLAEGVHYWFPDAGTDAPCRPPAIATNKHAYNSQEISSAGCKGPNNCFTIAFKIQLCVVLVLFMIAHHLVAKFVFAGKLAAQAREYQKKSAGDNSTALLSLDVEEVELAELRTVREW